MVKAKRDPVTKQAKRKQSEPVDEPPAKRSNTDDCVVTGAQPGEVDGMWPHLRLTKIGSTACVPYWV